MVPKLHGDLVLLSGQVVVILLLGQLDPQPCSAITLALPDVGTAINYDFLEEAPIFVIAGAAPAQEIIQSEVTFTSGKFLFIETGSNFHSLSLGVDLNLRAVGIADVFEPLFIRFDETLSLLRKDGSISVSARNIGVGTYENNRDVYTFAWWFDTLPESTIYGFRWSITPNLIAGEKLPDFLKIEAYMWAGESIRVVPEPTSAAIAMCCVIAIAMIGRQYERSFIDAKNNPQ